MADTKVYAGKEGIKELWRRVKAEIGKFTAFQEADPVSESDRTPDVPVADRKTNIIYLVEEAGATPPDIYKEWIWTLPEGSEGEWVCIGDTSMDLSDMAKKSEMSVETVQGDPTKKTIQLKTNLAQEVVIEHQDISGKQDVISDLGAIRTGAAAGATAYQKPNTGIPSSDMTATVQASLGLADSAVQPAALATKQDKPSNSTAGDIATFDSGSSTVDSGKAFLNSTGTWDGTSDSLVPTAKSIQSKLDEKYTRPASGIPKTDLASPVNASLDKADSAIQHVYAGQEELVPVSQTVTIPYAEVEQPVHEVTIGGRTYHTVTMPDGKEWLAENLDYQFCEVGGSGNPAEAHAWYYNNDQATYGASGRNCGLLYNGYAALYLEEHKDTLLPAGWRVPTSADFITMLYAVDPFYPAEALKGPAAWADPQWRYTNRTEFNVVPSGYYSYSGTFGNDTGFCGLMTSTATTAEITRYDLVKTDPYVQGGQLDLRSAASIRLINDTPVSPLPTYMGGLMTSGMNEKLDGIEAHAEVNVQADWNVSDNTSDAFIKNKPSLATVATSGSYADLSNKPNLDNYAEKSTTVTSVTWDSSTSKLTQTINGTSTEIVDLSGMETVTNKVTTVRDTSTATDTAYPSEKAVATALATKQGNLEFDGTYDPSTNKVATESTVADAISGLSGCTVTYTAGTGELHLDFRPANS